jgi:hypothetical protein
MHGDDVSAHEQIKRESVRWGLTPQALAMLHAEEHFREQHESVLSAMKRALKKELRAAEPEERTELRERHMLTRSVVRWELGIEVRRIAAILEHDFLILERKAERQRSRVPQVTPSRLKGMHSSERAALRLKHASDASLLRMVQELSGSAPSASELTELADVHTLERWNMRVRQKLEDRRAAKEPARAA